MPSDTQQRPLLTKINEGIAKITIIVLLIGIIGFVAAFVFDFYFNLSVNIGIIGLFGGAALFMLSTVLYLLRDYKVQKGSKSVTLVVLDNVKRLCPKDKKNTSQEIIFVRQGAVSKIVTAGLLGDMGRNPTPNFFAYRCKVCGLSYPINEGTDKLRAMYKWSNLSGKFAGEEPKKEEITLAENVI
jgi:hypothetical protein